MSLRTGGVRPWLWQRLTAVYMVVFLVTFGAVWVVISPLSLTVWRDLLAQTWVNIAAILFCLAVLGHAWIGMRDIVLDYVGHTALRFSLLVLSGGYVLAMAVWVTKILLLVQT